MSGNSPTSVAHTGAVPRSETFTAAGTNTPARVRERGEKTLNH